MGHLFLGRLPRTNKWNEVIALLETGNDVPDIAHASMEAVQSGLKNVPNDPGYQQALVSVFHFIDSLQSPDPIRSLKANGFDIPADPLILDYVGSFKRKVDRDLAFQKTRSDISEIAQNSFTETLIKSVTASQSLFQVGAGEVLTTLKRQFTGRFFKTFMHEFFTGFTRRYLQSYLSRALPGYIGPNRPFESMDSHKAFNEAFDLYIRQTIRITDEFIPGWYGKTRFEGRLTSESVTRFAHAAFRKISSEFDRGIIADG